MTVPQSRRRLGPYPGTLERYTECVPFACFAMWGVACQLQAIFRKGEKMPLQSNRVIRMDFTVKCDECGLGFGQKRGLRRMTLGVIGAPTVFTTADEAQKASRASGWVYENRSQDAPTFVYCPDCWQRHIRDQEHTEYIKTLYCDSHDRLLCYECGEYDIFDRRGKQEVVVKPSEMTSEEREHEQFLLLLTCREHNRILCQVCQETAEIKLYFPTEE